MLAEIAIASVAVMFVSLSGVLTFFHFDRILKSLNYLVSISVGIFLGVVFHELIPETFAIAGDKGSIYILIGFLGFFVFSHLLSGYHHHHGEDCHENHAKAGGVKVIIGDAIHNLVDGITITAAFLVATPVGIATTLGVILHELPQEIAEFFVLVKSGYSKGKALLLNFITSSTVLIGSVISYFFLDSFTNALGVLLGIATGNLLYIAASDIIPELRAKREVFWQQFAFIVIGVVLILVVLGLGTTQLLPNF
ncbi:ZIP zinc transporter [Candidatus Wolfebacteria bacterium]|nr:MAG: ZIP zinc transporter [Candidatus Wolfebacteria bacterium]